MFLGQNPQNGAWLTKHRPVCEGPVLAEPAQREGDHPKRDEHDQYERHNPGQADQDGHDDVRLETAAPSPCRVLHREPSIRERSLLLDPPWTPGRGPAKARAA